VISLLQKCVARGEEDVREICCHDYACTSSEKKQLDYELLLQIAALGQRNIIQVMGIIYDIESRRACVHLRGFVRARDELDRTLDKEKYVQF